MSWPSTGRTWIVTSRATADCHSMAADRTSMTAPRVRPARNVMMATTAINARPAIVSPGTIEVRLTGKSRPGRSDGSAWWVIAFMRGTGSFVNVQPAFVQHQPAGIEQVHQGDIVGGNDDGRAGLVQFDEE